MHRESIDNRRTRMKPGGAEKLKETDDDRAKIRVEGLKDKVRSEDAHIIHVDEQRLQMMRHRPGNLDSYQNLDEEKIEKILKETKAALREYERKYIDSDNEIG